MGHRCMVVAVVEKIEQEVQGKDGLSRARFAQHDKTPGPDCAVVGPYLLQGAQVFAASAAHSGERLVVDVNSLSAGDPELLEAWSFGAADPVGKIVGV